MPIPPVNLGGNITVGQGAQLPSATGPMVPSNGDWFQQNAPQGSGFQFDPSKASDPDYQKQFVDDRVMATQGRHATDQDYAYWLPKFAQAGGLGDGSYWYSRMTDPQGTGSNAPEGGGAPGGGQSLQGLLGLNPGYGIFQNLSGGMTPQQILGADPGYQFAQQQGNDAIQRSAAAKGTLLTGGTLKDLGAFNTGLAAQDYGNIFNRQFNLANLGSNIYQGQVTNNQNLANLGRPT